ncbi:UDP-glycosyltransferase 73C4-like [Mangifera indica]|uniref:UDP-glycosyltransferase 73C4-like n=1 Tax=Mangifera indica TaxID=29780 RepID=UPI001CF9F244|nr:UDP-glycosyltransferase 73C4-like [Mangifera indica]
MEGQICVVAGYGLGHLHPCMELCKHISSMIYHTTLLFPSIFASAIPPSFLQRPRSQIVQLTSSGRPMPGSDPLRQPCAEDLETHLLNCLENPDLPTPLCAIVDFQMGWTKALFSKFNIPVISLFTFGACAAAMEWGAWKIQASNITSGETRVVPGLPEEMALTYSDLKRKPGGPPKPGDMPRWVPGIEGSIALMFNTCDDIDGPFIKYIGDQMGLPAWGVGPLLPEQYWKSSEPLIRDREIGEQKRQSSLTDQNVIQWLDSKPHGSVTYVAFGSEVGPTTEEYQQLAGALEESTRPFIWVIQPGSEAHIPQGLDDRVGNRGLIIYGWAPQLMILSHESTGGFLSHCGWNSTMEAIGRGIPFLAWPIRGDQFFNAKLVVSHLKIGYIVADDLSEMVKKDDIVKGIESVMGDEEMKKRAEILSGKFEHGFPATSVAALEAFSEFISKM